MKRRAGGVRRRVDASVGLACAALGAVLVSDPAVVASWPGVAVRPLVVVLGVVLVVDGVLRGVAAVRGTADQRLTALVAGTASMVLGLLALVWQDVPVVVVAVLFGVRMVLYGLTRLWTAIRNRGPLPPLEERPPRLHRFAAVLCAAASLAVALVVLAAGVVLHLGVRAPDAFYNPPADVPAVPGQLLRSEPFTRGIPDGTNAWRILYTTTRADQVPAVASALVMVAADAPSGPRPVIAWAHGTTGYEPGCAPTLLKDPLDAGGMVAVRQVVSRGWVLVATDYVGLGTRGPHPYLVGQGEARSVLDAVRAARQLTKVSMSDKTVVWGHSQGGHAALWTGIVQPHYAPDVPLSGVAALAPATDLQGLVGNVEHVTGGILFASYLVQAYADNYTDVDFDTYVRPAAQVQTHEMAGRCLAEPEVLASVVDSLLLGRSIFGTDPATGPFGAHLRQNTPSGPITVPLLIAQGQTDQLIPPATQGDYVRRRCAAGGRVEYRTYPGRDHVTLVADDSPVVADLVRWTIDRFSGRPAPSNCPAQRPR